MKIILFIMILLFSISARADSINLNDYDQYRFYEDASRGGGVVCSLQFTSIQEDIVGIMNLKKLNGTLNVFRSQNMSVLNFVVNLVPWNAQTMQASQTMTTEEFNDKYAHAPSDAYFVSEKSGSTKGKETHKEEVYHNLALTYSDSEAQIVTEGGFILFIVDKQGSMQLGTHYTFNAPESKKFSDCLAAYKASPDKIGFSFTAGP